MQPLLGGWYVDDLYVPIDERRKGLGRELVRRVQREIATIGADSLYLMPAGENADAIKRLAHWYRHLGFVKHQCLPNNSGWVLVWKVPRKA